MTRYYGGCSRCGGHKGEFEGSLPNGCCFRDEFSGFYFCGACEKDLKDENERKKFSEKLVEDRRKYEADFTEEDDEFLLLDGGPGYATSLFVRKDFMNRSAVKRGGYEE